jgi:methionyl-tRNA formyltransferase
VWSSIGQNLSRMIIPQASSLDPQKTNPDFPRIVFMGTPDFAVPSLKALVESGLKPIAVVTGPDKERGRGRKLSATAVKDAATSYGITTILQPEDVKSTSFAEEIIRLKPDIIVVVAFRILPQNVFSAAKLGTFNLHGSLLPKYRGAAPINRAIMAGDKETGVTTFLLQQKVDTGDVLIKRSMSIGENETAGEVHDRMSVLGAEVVVETVKMILSGNYSTAAQDDREASPAPKIFREDCQIQWSRSSEDIHNQIRGLSPYPGAYTSMGGKQIKILKSTTRSSTGSSTGTFVTPGTVTENDSSLVVACGTDRLELQIVQLEGKKAMPVIDFLRGNSVDVGMHLGDAQ